MGEVIRWWTGVVLLAFMAWADHRERRISNRMVLLLLVLQMGCLVLLEREVVWMDHLWGMAFAVLLVSGTRWVWPGGIGGGDGKLFLVLGLTMGFDMFLWMLFVTLLILTVVILLQRARAGKQYPMGPAIWMAYVLTGMVLKW